MDPYSDLLYLHLQNSLTSKDKVQYKREFYAYSHNVGFRIRYYNSDNVIFQYNTFMRLVKDEKQAI